MDEVKEGWVRREGLMRAHAESGINPRLANLLLRSMRTHGTQGCARHG